MHRRQIAIGFSYLFIYFAVAGGQSRPIAAPSQAATQLASSDSRDEACQPKPPTATVPFDTCKYLTPGSGIRLPRATSAPNPQYPEAARKAKLSGSVVVALAINEKGRVDDVRVVSSSNSKFEQNAMDAGRQWEFVPAAKDGKAVAVQMNVEMSFKLY